MTGHARAEPSCEVVHERLVPEDEAIAGLLIARTPVVEPQLLRLFSVGHEERLRAHRPGFPGRVNRPNTRLGQCSGMTPEELKSWSLL